MSAPLALDETALRRTALIVSALNLAYFVVEVIVAPLIGSVSLFADSADFAEDAAVNALIVLALGWSLAARARLGGALALISLLPAGAALWTGWQKFSHGGVPEPLALGLVGLGALMLNLLCAGLLVRHRGTGGSLGTAAWLAARNDALGNVAIMAAAATTAFAWHSYWPDLAVGAALFVLNLDAAGDIWKAARRERKALAA